MFFSKTQKRYIFHWIRWIIIGEFFILVAGIYAWIIFLLAGISFFVAFILRIIKKYPCNPEPLILDISSGTLAIISAIIYYYTAGVLVLQVVKIILPFIIIMPHFVYIIMNKDLPPKDNFLDIKNAFCVPYLF